MDFPVRVTEKHVCKTCDARFSRKIILVRHSFCHTDDHSSVHTGQKSEIFSCGVCQKEFTQKLSLQRHLSYYKGRKLHSSKASKKSFVCKTCHRKCPSKEELNNHLLTHRNAKLYSCKICHKKLASSSNFKLHLRVHTGERPYSCEVCQKRFTQSAALKVHMDAVHSATSILKAHLPVMTCRTLDLQKKVQN
ncbi:hypothetical protein JTE90_003303 [Oedothorax gibbosus]|uniref:C2H2-type domain-containing protein n=1 Tax=Oedothorax gibbosus TaxID=931172 RepID=A0AAV6TY93_9ARAC|nr:hypothetical protein JTE90_003303 [Oedothorax gibbosus]